MMVLALFLSVRGELFISQNYRNQTAALYLAETGLWDAVSQLEMDPTWTTGFDRKSVPGQEGSYTVTFNTTGAPFTDAESVNNHDGASDENFRGDGYVPTGCANIVVTANVGGSERQVEALVRIGGGIYPAEAPLMTSGRVDLRGGVSIDGRKSQGDPTRVDANVHSNKADEDADIIVWDENGTAHIDGKVSTVAPNANAINLGGLAPSGGTEVGAPRMNIPDVNILAKVGQNRNAPAANINPTGITTLSPASPSEADTYHGGDLNIQGDLVLDGVNLYVEGELHVNGSITGTGSVFVTGGTTLQGDARIASATPETIALFSEGNVRLSGFNGTEYMESLAASDPTLAAAWGQLGDSIRDYQTLLSEPGASISHSNLVKLNALAQEIGGAGNTNMAPVTVPGRQHNAARTLIEALQSQPDSTARNSMMEKFEDLDSLFYSYVDDTQIEAIALQNLAAGRITQGGFDAAIDNFNSLPPQQRHAIKNLMKGYVDSIDYNHLGAAYFQGMIFTHGSVYTDAEVTVQGAVAAFDNGSQDPTEINGEMVDPGDLVLQPSTRISYIEEFFKPKDATGGAGAAGVQLLLWMGR